MAAAREGKVNQMLDELTSLRAHVEVIRKKLALSKDIEALNLGRAIQHCVQHATSSIHTCGNNDLTAQRRVCGAGRGVDATTFMRAA